MEEKIVLPKKTKKPLDIAYNRFMINLLDGIDEIEEYRWSTYNLIITELIKLDKVFYYDEIKYRITDGEKPNLVLLDILNRESDNISSFLFVLKRKLEEYVEDDELKKFFN